MNQGHSQAIVPLNVKDFGATGNGVVDDSSAIQEALNAAPDGAIILFPAGTYRVETEVRVHNRSGIQFHAQNAHLTAGTTRFRSFFHCDNSRDLTFEGFGFDQHGTKLPPYMATEYGNTYQCPIYFVNGEGLSVENCEFEDLYSLSVFFFQSSGMEVAKCIFRCSPSTNNQWLQFVHLQTYSGANIVSDCEFRGFPTRSPSSNPAAVFASGGRTGSSLTIENNKAEYCGRNNDGSHRLGVFDIYGDAQNIVIRNNISLNTMAQFARVSATKNAIVSKNRVSMSVDAEFDYSILTIESVLTFRPGQVGCQNIEVSGNKFEDGGARAAFAVGVLSYDWGCPATKISVIGNIFVGCRRSVAVYGPFDGVSITNNSGNSGRNGIEIGHNGMNSALVTSKISSERQGGFEKLLINLNAIINDTANDANALTINLSKNPRFSGAVGSFEVRNNSFRRLGGVDAGQAIAVIINAETPQGMLSVSGNETEGYTHDWYVRGTKAVTIEDNRAVNSGGQPYLDDGTNGTVSRRNNRFSVK